jgi:hypothetical protein
MMRWSETLGVRTYPLVISRFVNPIDLWTLCGVTYSLENGGLPRICSSNNEDPELDIVGNSREIRDLRDIESG